MSRFAVYSALLLSDYCIKTCSSFNFISIFTFCCSVAFSQLIINYYDDDDDDDDDDCLFSCVVTAHNKLL